MHTEPLIEKIQSGEMDRTLLDIYVDESKVEYQRERYIKTIRKFEKYYGCGEVAIFSAPGRSEIGGNHTDHQHGEVLAASVNLDTLGVVRATGDNTIRVISDDGQEIVISLEDVSVKLKEKGTTTALIKGVVEGFAENGYQVGGFCAYITSDVLIGAGLSSSAAFETLIGTVLSGLYNDMKVLPVEIAMIGQFAENVYFGKPCGLMDQMACSVGNLVYIDFKDPANPKVEKVAADMDAFGYSLCITDTKGSHADLTDEYAAVPEEMKRVARYFGKDVLREITVKEVLEEIHALRKSLGDRCVLRALHFIIENERVQKEVDALKNGNIKQFLASVKASGDSSYKYLQNVYSGKDLKNQNVSVALMISEMLLEDAGVSRVHGGGFAGTIQAFVKKEYVPEYKRGMDAVFGDGACSDLRIRKYGGIKVI
ncbi:MAG: galactokinase [Lachnospiraceae bacterium]|nr:galactokinase [Lachnospiraceae bacterium]